MDVHPDQPQGLVMVKVSLAVEGAREEHWVSRGQFSDPQVHQAWMEHTLRRFAAAHHLHPDAHVQVTVHTDQAATLGQLLDG